MQCGGVVVITCADDICIFIELMKRLVAQSLTENIDQMEDKVSKLIPLFEPQLSKLGATRPAKDWIEDNIFNPAFANGNQLSMSEAIDIFGSFDLLGSSPNIFTDYSWYKNTQYNNTKDYKEQFNRNRMSLIMAGLTECNLEESISESLVSLFQNIKILENEYEKHKDISKVSEIIRTLSENQILVKTNMSKSFVDVYIEIIDVLKKIYNKEVIDMEKYSNFFVAFGRGLQYMSFMKVGE